MTDNRNFGFFGPGCEWIWWIIIILILLWVFCPGFFGGIGFGCKE